MDLKDADSNEIHHEFLTCDTITPVHPIELIQNFALPLLDEISRRNADPSDYSDPSIQSVIPFPAIRGREPSGRFHLIDGKFTFMGRLALTQIYNDTANMRESEPREYFPNGSQGWGKSHILALVTRLRCLQRVFYPSYARDTAKLEQLRQATKWEYFKEFSEQQFVDGIQIIYILDQVDTFDQHEHTLDSLNPVTEYNVTENNISGNHILVQSTSTNMETRTSAFYRSDDDGTSQLSSVPPKAPKHGKSSKRSIEMKAWWKHQEDKKLLPTVLVDQDSNAARDAETLSVQERRKEVEDLTDTENLSYTSFMNHLVRHEHFLTIERQICEFYKENRRCREGILKEYLALMNACISSSGIPFSMLRLLDTCFFMVTDQDITLCASGFARDVMKKLFQYDQRDGCRWEICVDYFIKLLWKTTVTN
ncbi:hypothetical protein Dda_8815 [Drechslerella dactyloides]|uniref:Uncharacterized protein n=1 Tax=Drechslerella dactyloides TaxID=74499 RepID=A0AAD6ITW1_DREDA|nr:hypothetical protein Dda_8815 [Drechslerella dactyloides]